MFEGYLTYCSRGAGGCPESEAHHSIKAALESAGQHIAGPGGAAGSGPAAGEQRRRRGGNGGTGLRKAHLQAVDQVGEGFGEVGAQRQSAAVGRDGLVLPRRVLEGARQVRVPLRAPAPPLPWAAALERFDAPAGSSRSLFHHS